MVVFANVFKVEKELQEILRKNAKGKIYLWNYAAGILNPEFSFENVRALTGFAVKEFAHDFKNEQFGYKIKQFEFGPVSQMELDFPLIEILSEETVQTISAYPNDKIMCARTQKDGGISVLCAFPSMMAKEFRELAIEASCKMYAPVNCTVYADNRIIGIFPKEDVSYRLDLGNFSVGEKHSLEINIKAKGAEYFIYD